MDGIKGSRFNLFWREKKFLLYAIRSSFGSLKNFFSEIFLLFILLLLLVAVVLLLTHILLSGSLDSSGFLLF